MGQAKFFTPPEDLGQQNKRLIVEIDQLKRTVGVKSHTINELRNYAAELEAKVKKFEALAGHAPSVGVAPASTIIPDAPVAAEPEPDKPKKKTPRERR